MLFLPHLLNDFVSKYSDKLRELRIRKNLPVYANIDGNYVEVKINGKSCYVDDAEMEKIINVACKSSIYLFNENIKNGFITCENGIRIGIGGECIVENNCVKTIKNFYSLCIRFPRQIIGCANEAFEIIDDNLTVKSLLVIAPPGGGKTTLLRDLTRIISNVKRLNILLVDEKNEIFYEGCDIGKTTDVLSSCPKKFGFYTAIKTLAPDVIVADELTEKEDVDGLIFASLSGVKVISSIHGDSLKAIRKKGYINQAIEMGIFEKFVTLTKDRNNFNVRENKL